MEKMTWETITRTYPNEWVALADAHESSDGVQDGTVVAHAPERMQFHALTRSIIDQYHNLSIAYTGQLVIPTDLPFLWQISHTTPSTD